MSDTFLLLSSSAMSDEHERIRRIKCHINQLLSELRIIEPNSSYLENFQAIDIAINSSLTTLSHEKCLLDKRCPYLTRKQTILHSTMYHQHRKLYKKKKSLIASPKKSHFTTASCITSTPKNSPTQSFLLKPHLTSTPRRHKYQSPDLIPLKRLLYKTNKCSHRQRHSARRSILPRYSSLQPVDEYPQWI